MLVGGVGFNHGVVDLQNLYCPGFIGNIRMKNSSEFFVVILN